MPKTTKDELPGDLGPDELNEMIRDLGLEMGCPWWAGPDLVELDHIPQHVYGCNTGCNRTGLDEYREGQKWRRKLISELKRRPDWVAEWRAEQEMDRRVRELCDEKGLQFMPHECPPWEIRVNVEISETSDFDCWAYSARLAQRLRRQLEAELRNTR